LALGGRCWLCGTKFNCSGNDIGARVYFRDLQAIRSDDDILLLDDAENLCVSCVEAIDGDGVRGPNEPHGDGMPKIDRLAEIIRILAITAQRRTEP
jgi:hypothetical protein